MAIVGIGTDLIAVARIERVWRRHGERFLTRILSVQERSAFASARRPGNRLAKAFAAKEAFVKALGTGFRDVTHRDVGVHRDALGAPQLHYSPSLQAMLEERRIKAHLSLSDDDGRVLAFVVLETGACGA